MGPAQRSYDDIKTYITRRRKYRITNGVVELDRVGKARGRQCWILGAIHAFLSLVRTAGPKANAVVRMWSLL